MIRLLLIDDHTIFREGLKRLLAEQEGFDVVAEAGDASDALRRVRQEEFDVALLDVNMPGRSGLEMLPSFRAERPALPIVVLSMYPAEGLGKGRDARSQFSQVKDDRAFHLSRPFALAVLALRRSAESRR